MNCIGHERGWRGVCFFGGSAPAGNTTTTTSSGPWTAQQPYLQAGMAAAANQYNSQPNGYTYYPGQQVAGLNSQQQDVAGQQYTNAMSHGSQALNTGMAAAQQIASGNPGQNPGSQLLQNAASGGMMHNPGSDQVAGIANGMQVNRNPGSAMMQNTARGGMLSANNPYFNQMAQTTLANTMPGIDSSFNGGGRMDSGLATRAASQGANDAVGGLAYGNYQQGLQNQLTAQQAIGQNYNQGVNQQLQGAGLSSSNYNTGQGLMQNAATTIGQNYQGDQSNILKAGLVAQGGDAQQMADVNNGMQAGNMFQNQAQNQIGANMNAYNYNQQQPNAALGRYSNLIQGTYGQQSTQTQPYYQNQTANTMAGITGGLGILNGLTGNNSSMYGAM